MSLTESRDFANRQRLLSFALLQVVLKTGCDAYGCFDWQDRSSDAHIQVTIAQRMALLI